MTRGATLRWLLASIALLATLRGAEVPRTAVLDFVRAAAPGGMEPGLADFSRAVQAKLLASADYTWIERQEFERITREVDLAGIGASDPATAVRLGKWLRADLLLRGEIAVGEDRGELKLEVIDLKRADLLATRTVPVTIGKGRRVRPTAAEVDGAAAAALAVLEESRAALARTAGLQVIAPLYFKNISRTDRINFLEGRLAAALDQAAIPAAGFHVLKFPQTSAASGEAELVLGGLTDTDPEAWQHVADAYLWATVEEKGRDGDVFETVPVVILLQAWNGFGPPQETKWEGPVRDLDQGVQTVVTGALQGLKPMPAGAARDTGERDRVAEALLMRAGDISRRIQGSQFKAGVVASGVSREDFGRSTTGRALVAYRQQLVEIAAFLKPLDKNLENMSAQGRRTRGVNYDSITAGWRWLTQAQQAARKAGAAVDEAAVKELTDSIDALRKAVFAGPEPVWHQGGVNLTPDEVRDQRSKVITLWCDHVVAVNRAVTALPPPVWLIKFNRDRVHGLTGLLPLVDTSRARKMVEQLWPVLEKEAGWVIRTELKPGEMSPSRSQELITQIVEVYDAFGDNDRAIALLDRAWAAYIPEAASGGGEGPGRSSFMDPPAPRPWGKGAAETLPTLKATIREIEPWSQVYYRQEREGDTAPLQKLPARTVDELAWHRGRLWIAETTAGQLPLPAGAGPRNPDGEHYLWSYDPALHQADLATTRLAGHTTIRALLSHGENLWLGFDGEGLWRWNPDEAGKEPRRFKGEDGLITSRIRQAQAGTDALYFLGGDFQKPAMARYDLASENWLGMEALPPGGSPFLMGKPQQRAMAVFGEWLGFADGEPMFFNTTTKTWKRLARPLVIPPGTVVYEPPRFYASVISADESGFWLGRENMLRLLDPRAPEQQRDMVLPGLPVAAVHSGPWLWLLLEDRLVSAEQEIGLAHMKAEPGKPKPAKERPTRLALVDKRTFACVGVLPLPSIRMRKLVVGEGRVWVGGPAVYEIKLSTDAGFESVSNPIVPPDFPLHRAAWAGDLAALGALLEKKTDVNQATPGGGTPLLAAVAADRNEAVRRLLAAGADPNRVARDGTSPLRVAVENENPELVELLLARGANPNLPAPAVARGLNPMFSQVREPVPHVESKTLPRPPARVQAAPQANGEVLLTWEDRADNESLYFILSGSKRENVTLEDELPPDTTHWTGRPVEAFSPQRSKEKSEVKQVTFWVKAANGASHWAASAEDAVPVTVSVTIPPQGETESTPDWSAISGGVDSAALGGFTTPLMAAAIRGSLPLLRTLLAKGAKPDMTDGQGRTALQLASRRGQTEAVRLLLTLGANPGLADMAGETPVMAAYIRHEDESLLRDMLTVLDAGARRQAASALIFEAARRGQAQDFEMLQSLGGDLGATLTGGESALSAAIQARQTAAAVWLIEHGFPHKRMIWALASPQPILDEVYEALLHTDADDALGRAGAAIILGRLIDAGVDVIRKEGFIRRMVVADRIELVHCLKQHGIDLSRPIGGESLETAAKSEAMRQLLGVGAATTWTRPVRVDRRGTGIIYRTRINGQMLAEAEVPAASLKLLGACERGDFAAARQALAEGAVPDCRNEAGMTPLCFAARRGDLPQVQWLVENGASVSFPTQAANFALGFAAESGRTAVVEFLLGAGANVNAHGEGLTALMAAVSGGQPAMVMQLLAAGADPDLCGGGGQTYRQNPLAMALQEGNKTVADLLVAHGANTRARFDPLQKLEGDADPRRQTTSLLMYAAESGNLELIRQAMSWGQDPKYQTNDGYDALTFAARAGKKEAVEFLLPLSAHAGRAMESAADKGHTDIVKILQRAGYQSP